MKFNSLHATLIAVAIYDATVHARNRRKVKALQEDNYFLACHVDSCHAKLSYLATMMDQHEIPVSEFDLIVLNSL
jgi:hypothetical protein